MCLTKCEKVTVIDDIKCYKQVELCKDENGRIFIRSPFQREYEWELKEERETKAIKTEPSLYSVDYGYFHTFMNLKDAVEDTNYTWYDYRNDSIPAVIVSRIPKETETYCGMINDSDIEGWASRKLIPEKIVYVPKVSQLRNVYRFLSKEWFRSYFVYRKNFKEITKYFGLNSSNCKFKSKKVCA